MDTKDAGSMGGIKSSGNLTPEQRRKRASLAAKAAHDGRTPEERSKLASKAISARYTKRKQNTDPKK